MKTPGKPIEFRGPLTAKQVSDGMNAALRNAKRLLDDARLLLEADRHASAVTLAILAIEEAGKVSILRGISTETDTTKLEEEWRRYRDHRSKNGAWILPQLVADGARRLHEFGAVVDRDAEHTVQLNTLKQISCYTDCYAEAHWSEPSKVMDCKLAEYLIHVAAMFTNANEVSAREIELWIQYVGPTRETQDLRLAVIEWADAVHAEGLRDSTALDMARFIFGEENVHALPEGSGSN